MSNSAVAGSVHPSRLVREAVPRTRPITPERAVGWALCLYLLPVIALVLAIGGVAVCFTRAAATVRSVVDWVSEGL